jgi:hypothetical protein
LQDLLQGAQREAFLHGREFFDEFKKFAFAVFVKHQLACVDLSYDVLKQEYLDGVFQAANC